MRPAEGTLCFDDRALGFDKVMEGLLIGALVFMPFAFGVVHAWSEEIVIAFAAALSLCFLLKGVVFRGVPFTWTWAYVPVVVFIAVVLIQLIPMPVGWIGLFSPNTVAQKTTLLNDVPEAGKVLSAMTVSFYTWATRHDLRLVLAVGAVFVVVFNVYRRPSQITRLLGAITAIGASVALLALAQNIAGNGKIYWSVLSPHGTAHSGPFVNHSHYAQFMNLSVGAALGFIFVKVHQRFRHTEVTPAAVTDYLGSSEAKLVWAAAAMVALGMASVFVSMSRGGMISMIIAGAFTALVLCSKKAIRGSGWVMALLVLGAFICVLCMGFNAVYDRLGSLRELHQAEGGRWQIVQDIAVAWTRFPVLGTGLGTHEVVYPMFDRSAIAALASHAENEYAQAAEETGAIGLAALVAFAVLVWRDYARTIRTGRAPIHSAACGLGFGLVAIMIHSLSDFGQHLPANAFLSVIFCALLVRLPHIEEEETEARPSLRASFRRSWLVSLAAVIMLWGWVLPEADAARLSEAHWEKVLVAERGLAERRWRGSNVQYTYLLQHAQQAVDHQPDNAQYRHWLNVYRWYAVARTIDPNAERVGLPSADLEFAERIAAELSHVRVHCPTFGPTWCVLGQLERFVLDRKEEGARNIRSGVALAPCDPTARFVAGMLEVEEGQIDAAADHLSRAVQLDASLFGEVAFQLVEQFGQLDLALEIAANDVDRLSILAKTLETSGKSAAATDIRKKVVVLLEQKCREPGAPAQALAWLASVRQEEGSAMEAIDYYRRALALNFEEVQWRLNLALLLANSGRVRQAREEAEVCLQLRPGFVAARRLLDRLALDSQSTE